MRTKILLGTLVSFLGVLNAQNEVLTKVDGGASWLTGSGGIYSGDGETPSDVDVTVTDHIDFDAGTLFIDGEDHRIGIGTTVPLSYKNALLYMKEKTNQYEKLNPRPKIRVALGSSRYHVYNVVG